MRKYLLMMLAVFACIGFSGAWAQQRLEIIPLQHRLPEQVLPALLPLVEAGGTLTTANNKLILRASPANIDQIRQALAAIDTPQRRLMISVRQSGSNETAQSGGGIESGRVVIDGSGRMTVSGNVRLGDSTRQGSVNSQQQVQTVEGGDASIFLGRSLALPMRQIITTPGGGAVVGSTIQYVDVGNGFAARPELVGERVTVTITPQMQRIERNGNISGSRLSTQISGRLGEWIALGGGTIDDSSLRRGTLEGREQRVNQSAEVWLKVDVID